MIVSWFFLFPLVVLSVAEVWLVLTLGPLLGTWWTVLWMVLSLFLGVFILRVEGMIKLVRIHKLLLAEEIPTNELLDLFLVIIGAGLLILPGFLTDFFGFLFLVPPVRWGLRGLVLAGLSRLLPGVGVSPGPIEPSPDIIEIFPDKDPR